MRKRRIAIRKHDARVILSDLLPYELPPSYNNRGFYDFIRAANLRVQGNKLVARKIDDSTEALLRIVLGRDVCFPAGAALGETVELELPGGKAGGLASTIPFNFTVRHRGNDYRTLTVPHPAAQIDVVDFYAKYSDLLLYYTSMSRFSLRHPARVAPYSVVGDWLFEQNLREHDSVEQDTHEYAWLRSYFTYRRYSNVYKFYDSKEYRSCERRFGYLVKADIAKCFDSIYTHSVAWAAHGHATVKANVSSRGAMNRTFGDDFDLVMRRLNHNETSGITIGSEVSRIFAEVILQAVDRDVYQRLTDAGLEFGVDYEVLRYVDDYFIFLADAHRRVTVLDALSSSLRRYKLHLNASKEEGEYTPWLSPLTVAKRRIVELLRATAKRRDKALDVGRLPRPYVDTSALIIGYKAILIDTGVSHFELANYALARAERTVEKLVRSSQKHLGGTGPFDKLERMAHHDSLAAALLGLLDFVFFAYSGAPRQSPAVKVARVASSLLRFSRQPDVPAHTRERIEMRVRDELLQQLRRSKGDAGPDAVTATLVDCLSDLGATYALSEAELADVCGFSTSGTSLAVPARMNALLLFSILLHIKRSKNFARVSSACELWILSLLLRPATDAERAIVCLNALASPYVSRATRVAILAEYGYTAPSTLDQAAQPGGGWNIDWHGFDLYAALQKKRLFEVY
jgi:hypothetical protein